LLVFSVCCRYFVVSSWFVVCRFVSFRVVWFVFFPSSFHSKMSAGSGILPTAEALAEIDELRKNNSKYIFALFKVEGNNVVPDAHFPNSDADNAALKAGGDVAIAARYEKEVWPKFTAALESAKGPRFAVIDIYAAADEGRTTRTLTVVAWCPDKGVTAKQKMTFASTRTSFEAKINIGKKYPANDLSDLEFKTVLDTLKSSK